MTNPAGEPATGGGSVTGAEALVRTLEGLGVTHAFQVVGLGLIPVAEAFYRHRHRIRYVSALNETNLALVAQGYARAGHRPAFVNLYHASGTALAMMGMTTAWAEQAPVVFTSTVSSTGLAGRDQYAAVPRAVTEMSAQFTKWGAEVPSAERIPEFVERAFQIAATPPFGPVHLAFPMDFWTTQVAAPTSSAAVHPVAVTDLDGVRALARAVADSRRPLVIAGGEVARYGTVDTLADLAEAQGLPVAVEGKISDLGFPTTHPLFVGKVSAVPDTLARADCVLLLGVELTESGLAPGVELPAGATVCHVTADALALRRQVDADVAVVGHPAATLGLLGEELRKLADRTDAASRAEFLDDARAEGARRRDETRAMLANAAGDGGLSVADVALILDRLRPQGSIVVNHCASGEPFLEDLVAYDDPTGYLGISGKGSAQGWGGAAAIGVQLAHPGRRVIAVLGDGGFMFTSTAVYTAARYRQPVIYLVLNNGGWRDIAALSRAVGGALGQDGAEDAMGWTFDDPPIDHALFAQSLGLRSQKVSTREALEAAFLEALDHEQPTLIEVLSTAGDADAFARTFLG